MIATAVMLLAQATATPRPTIGPCLHEATVVMIADPKDPGTLPSTTPAFTVQVLIQVDPDGSVGKAHIYKSSGDPAVDAAVLKAAHATLYQPKVIDCKPVAGDYLLQYRLPDDFQRP